MVALVSAGVLLVGCSSPQVGEVEGVVGRFAAAVQRQDGESACRLLAPRSRSELERSVGKPCSSAILEEDLPGRLGRLQGTDVFGSAGRVVTSTDTTFLSRFRGGWKVSAAGCVLEPRGTYECRVKGS